METNQQEDKSQDQQITEYFDEVNKWMNFGHEYISIISALPEDEFKSLIQNEEEYKKIVTEFFETLAYAGIFIKKIRESYPSDTIPSNGISRYIKERHKYREEMTKICASARELLEKIKSFNSNIQSDNPKD